jgi:hypothetical protein
MRKFAVVLVVALVTALIFGACNKKECPAYSKTSTEQAGRTV